MTDHAGFGWVLLVLGLVIAGIGLVCILAPSISWPGRWPGGNVIVDQRGRPVLTPNGKRLIQYMDEAEAKGVRRFAARASYAVRKLAEEGAMIPRQ